MAGLFSKECRKNWLFALAGAGGLNLSVRLSKNPHTVSDDTQLTNMVEADYNGYGALVSSSWSAPAIATNGDAFILAPLLVFTKVAGGTFNTVYVAYITITIGGTDYLVMAENLPTAVIMALATDQVPYRPRLATRGLTA